MWNVEECLVFMLIWTLDDLLTQVFLQCTREHTHHGQETTGQPPSVLSARYLGTSIPPPLITSAYQLPTGQVLNPRPLPCHNCHFREQTPPPPSFIRKPEAALWQSRGTARNWPLCIFSSRLAVTHPYCWGCQRLPPSPNPPPRGSLTVYIIRFFQVKSCCWSTGLVFFSLMRVRVGLVSPAASHQLFFIVASSRPHFNKLRPLNAPPNLQPCSRLLFNKSLFRVDLLHGFQPLLQLLPTGVSYFYSITCA